MVTSPYETLEVEWGDPEPPRPNIVLRGHQGQWVEDIERDLATFSRILAVAPGGCGKTEIFSVLAFNAHHRGQRTLILANRDRLVRQTAMRVARSTGLEVDMEMAEHHASPFSTIVVASVQTLSRTNRLTGFDAEHFHLVVADECHFSMAPSHQKILRYFHYGSIAIEETWPTPADGMYQPKARIVGFTATPDIGERRSLMEFFQTRSVSYSYLEAVRDGWLIGPVQKSIPVKIDLRQFKAISTPLGMDFSATEVGKAMVPIIRELAGQIKEHAADRKTMCFVPSVECARLMAAALKEMGMQAFMAAGEYEGTERETEEFVAAGPGSVLSNAMIYGFGIDFPDVDCIAWYRATLSRAFYIQGVYRASRVVLPAGVLEACVDADARLRAIAASTKPSYLILDPLFVSDRIDLLDAYDLFTDKSEVKQAMKASGKLTPEAAEKGTRDFLAALAKEARKHARKASRTIDPISWAVTINDTAITNYVPETDRDRRQVTEGQAEFFRKNKIDASKITMAGLASKVIGRYMVRLQNNLATASQLSFMKQLGLPDDEAVRLTQREAGAVIDKLLAEKLKNRAS